MEHVSLQQSSSATRAFTLFGIFFRNKAKNYVRNLSKAYRNKFASASVVLGLELMKYGSKL
jgi:hypothetical protein